MLTPQEVSEHAFAKASFGGYNMAMVDEFLDQLTADYTALYKENATLKAKMKVLADSLEEYRATEKGMRRALLAAQQTADEMVKEAETRKSELLRGAEAEAQAKIAELHRQVADEEARLNAAQAATANFVAQVRETCRRQEEYLDSLSSVTAPPPVVDPVDQTAHAIEESVQRLLEQEDVEEETAEPEPEERVAESVSLYEELTGRSHRDQERARAFEEAPAEEVSQDTSPTRRIDFDNLQFGSNYDLK
ncbi:MAG: DivIVA domain-containing protein [Oscillospiraceae bacterium]